MPILKRRLEVFRAILSATEAKKIHWRKEDDDLYAGVGGDVRCTIQFFYPDLNGIAMDRDRVEMAVVTDKQVSHRCYVGSEGFELAISILRAGLSEEWGSEGDDTAAVEQVLGDIARLL